ncbi:hypothetical protein [Daejeonella sp.]|uniref:hypothetical protein n=1 Tax=Daejeonella sp. TaxID=2805397 RepID=UPI0039831BAB
MNSLIYFCTLNDILIVKRFMNIDVVNVQFIASEAEDLITQLLLRQIKTNENRLAGESGELIEIRKTASEIIMLQKTLFEVGRYFKYNPESVTVNAQIHLKISHPEGQSTMKIKIKSAKR